MTARSVAYDGVLNLDPTNATAAAGKQQAVGLKRQVELDAQRRQELEQKTAVAPRRTIVESKTEFTDPRGQDGPKGFEVGGVEVRKATSAPTFPAQVIIEVNPLNAQPGQPYVLRVRVFNEGNRPIHVKSLELISSYGGKTIGKGQQIPARTQRVNPNVAHRRQQGEGSRILHLDHRRWLRVQENAYLRDRRRARGALRVPGFRRRHGAYVQPRSQCDVSQAGRHPGGFQQQGRREVRADHPQRLAAKMEPDAGLWRQWIPLLLSS